MDRMEAALLGAQRGRLHGALDQRLAGRGVHPAAVHGGPGRAAVPRVRDHAVGGGDDLARHLADDDADDVRLAAAARRRGARRSRRAGSRAGPSAASPACCRGYEASLDWALASLWLVLLHPGRRDRPQRLPVQRRAEGLLPAAGHRPAATAACAPTRASRRRRWARSCARSSTSSAATRRSTTVVGFTGGGRAGGGFMFVNLKPAAERTESGQAVIARLRPQLAQVTGLSVFLNTGAGRARRRPAEQLDLPVHAEERQPRRPAPLGDAAGRRDEAASRR